MSTSNRARSSKQTGPSLIHVPNLFSVVEPGVYRCASPTPAQVPFLAHLSLKTIISLTPEFPTKQLLAFTRNAGIEFLHLGTTLWRPISDWKPIQDEIVKATLELILDKGSHPLLIIDPLGIHQTGIIVGCLRVMQGWNFASTLIEYRAHSGPTKHRYSDEQYIELFDPDLINLPLSNRRPSWFHSREDETDGDDTDYEAEDDEGADSNGKKLKVDASGRIESGIVDIGIDPVDSGQGVG